MADFFGVWMVDWDFSCVLCCIILHYWQSLAENKLYRHQQQIDRSSFVTICNYCSTMLLSRYNEMSEHSPHYSWMNEWKF